MIHRVQVIGTAEPITEIWKLLRFYTHQPSVEKRIREVHNLKSDQFRADVSKQARQIGYCIRQAEQYFGAAKDVGLATRPLLLYYGLTSLSQAVVLLKRDGEFSVDNLRKRKKHQHHGLKLKGTPSPKASSPFDFLRSVEARCHTKDDKGVEPWGQFPIFYESLAPPAFYYVQQIRPRGSEIVLNQPLAQICVNLEPLDKLKTRTFNVVELLAQIPDMFHMLDSFGIGRKLIRGSLLDVAEVYEKPDPKALASAAKKTKKTNMVQFVRRTRDFFIDGLSANGKGAFNKLYKDRTPPLALIDDIADSLHYRSLTDEQTSKPPAMEYFPDIVDAIGGDLYFIAHPEDYVVEPAAFFIILFCLGFMSRYYPDIWMSALQNDIQTVELMNTFLNVAARKTPNLILDQLSDVKHFIRYA